MEQCTLGKVNEANIKNVSDAIVEIKGTFSRLFGEMKEIKESVNKGTQSQEVFIKEMRIHTQDIEKRVSDIEKDKSTVSEKVIRLGVHRNIHYGLLGILISGIFTLIGFVLKFSWKFIV